MVGRSPPTIETERLRLRPFRKEDLDPWVAILAKPDVSAYLGPPKSRSDLWLRLTSSVGQWYVQGYGGLMVELRDTGTLVGNVSLFEAKRGLGFEGEPELGYIVDSAVHGQGIGAEAVGAVLDWAEANMEPTPFWAIIDPANPASHRLAKKAGFEKVGEDVYEGDVLDIVKRPAW